MIFHRQNWLRTLVCACCLILAGDLANAMEPPGAPLVLTGVRGKLQVLTLSQQGQILAAAGKDKNDAGQPVIRVWDLTNGKQIATLPTESQSIRALAFHRSNLDLAIGDDQGFCRTYRISPTRESLPGKSRQISKSPITFVAYEKSEPALIIGSDRYRIWDFDNDQIVADQPAHDGAGVVQGCHLIDYTFIASCGGKQAGTIHPGTLKPMKTIGPLPYAPLCVAMNLQKNFAAVGLSDGSFELWKPVPGYEHGRIDAHRGAVTALAFPKDDIVVSAGQDGLIQFWDPVSGKLQHSIKAFPKPVVAMVASRIGPRLVATDGETIKFWYLGLPETQPQWTNGKPPAKIHLNTLANWTINRGEWKQEQGRLIGSKDSQIVYKLTLPNDLTFRFKMCVRGDTRPRIRFGSFFVGDDTPARALFLHGTKASGEKYPHERDKEIAVEVRISGEDAVLKIDNKEVARAHPKALEERTLTLEGGGRKSTGTTEFYDLELIYD